MGLCQSKEEVSNPTIEPTKETVNQVQIDQGISVKTNGEYLSGMQVLIQNFLHEFSYKSHEPFVTGSC